jgi:putative phosphoribosyl transferase
MSAEEIEITTDHLEATLKGILNLPTGSEIVVAFAHGSGSGRLSPRNQYVASVMNAKMIGTLLIDLLTEDEEAVDNVTREFRFDIPLLSERLLFACRWLGHHPSTSKLKIGLFGSSTGAAAALIAASKLQQKAAGVICRGGRSDLADEALSSVTAPVLFIVGEEDPTIHSLNLNSMRLLKGKKKLEIIPGATHLFGEPGALEAVARLSADWFKQ